MSKKKHTEAPPVDPAAEKNETDADAGQGELSHAAPSPSIPEQTAAVGIPPEPAKRTRASYVKRTRAQIAEDAEKERFAKLGPIERIAERKRVLVAALEAADQHVILAQSNRATAAKDLEDYTEESKPELDRLIAELTALRG